ncbi:stealth family protein [Sanguibacter sp. HDW7]|uniref:stealth family protein n=1 Tax=Sanguibacter sp. HDW7 TaxID=2714931 RepID=UPI00140E8962|nr:stealth family protein [Sanguibacter sp. HDW7]QIK82865.1 hypothetical protein G7063_03920 [Sanguibacter sp. HDW7]
MGIREKIAGHMSVTARLRASQVAHGQLGWQRALTSGVRSALAGTVPEGAQAVGPATRPLLGEVVTSFDSWDVRRGTLAAVVAVLRAADVPYVLLGTRPELVVVRAGEAERARAALAGLDSPGWTVRTPGRSRDARLRRHLRAPLRPTQRLFRTLVADDGTVLGGPAEGVVLEVWTHSTDAVTYDPALGPLAPGTLVAPSYNGTASHLSPGIWERARGTAEHRVVTASRLDEVREPIDVVYTWVDGTDEEWQAQRKAAEESLAPGAVNPNALAPSRFLGHDELRFSMRSIEMYASWVRHIHVVTNRQVPHWLDTSNPRVSVVRHDEIFADTSALPVFNSHAIESQLHRVPGLSDRYLYLNDDVFFGRPVAPELFFEGNGISRFFLSEALLGLDPPSVGDLPVMSAAKRNRALIEQMTGRTVTRKVKHTPHPQQRAVLEDLEREHPEVFAHLARSRFRDPADHSVAAVLHHWYAYVTGRAVEGRIVYDYLDLANEDAVLTLNRIARSRAFDVFCLNESDVPSGVREDRSQMIHDMLAAYFPLRSSFELPGR